MDQILFFKLRHKTLTNLPVAANLIECMEADNSDTTTYFVTEYVYFLPLFVRVHS